MDGKEAIINRIISEAEEKADGIKKDADLYADEKKRQAESWVKSYIEAQTEGIRKSSCETIDRRKIVAELEVKKNDLKDRRELIDKVFDDVYKKLCALDKKTYLALVEKLIEEYAEEGDAVIISNDGVLGSDDVRSLKTFSDKKLKLSDKLGDFKGGVKLTGKFCDKDVSFRSLVADLKEKYVTDVSKILFN